MIRRPILVAACTFAFVGFPAHFSRAAEAAADSSSASVSSATQAATDAESSQAAPADTTAPPARRYYRRISRHTTAARRLPSRGIVSPPEAASVVGRLAVVTRDRAVIVAGRETGGRVLSVCPKGQYLALSGQTPTQYAVLMVDHSLGFVSKSDVQLLEYQVVSTTPDPSAGLAPAAGAAPADGSLGQKLVQTAQGYLGVPYVWGGNTTAGIDCSGFVKAVYAAYGITLPRHSGDQAGVGYDVPRSDWSTWVPGDRMYFACHHPEIDHTGMYIGGGYFIHASAGHGHQVAIDRVDGAYYAAHLVCVRRSRELLGDAPAPGPIAQTASAAPAVDDPEAGQE